MMPLLDALVTVLVGALPSLVAGEHARTDEPTPRLVVVLCVDQLIPEQLERLAPWLDGGLGRFRSRGLMFRTAALDYARSETGPGHATLGTGLLPRHHGIIANGLLDREVGLLVECTVDPDVLTLAPGGVLTAPEQGGSSARNLLHQGLAEHLRARWPAS
ncbi:MAG: alkaline phosphatase family protein, partial [Planctomycetota bacterium]|nr:alkaline phosphatase family protein [Planctomycetota bacterium]